MYNFQQGLKRTKVIDTNSGDTSLWKLPSSTVSSTKGISGGQNGALHQFKALCVPGTSNDSTRLCATVFPGL